jgi:hypothetical protein
MNLLLTKNQKPKTKNQKPILTTNDYIVIAMDQSGEASHSLLPQ